MGTSLLARVMPGNVIFIDVMDIQIGTEQADSSLKLHECIIHL